MNLDPKTQPCPPAVRLALLVILNHVEPGWDNCIAVVQAWLHGEFPEPVQDKEPTNG